MYENRYIDIENESLRERISSIRDVLRNKQLTDAEIVQRIKEIVW